MAGEINLNNELLETTFATLVMMSRLLDKIENKHPDRPESPQQLDKQMMLEAVLAGIASLRKELDELEGNKGDKVTSDERVKKPLLKGPAISRVLREVEDINK